MPRHYRWLVAILALSVLLRVGVAIFYLGNVVVAPTYLSDQRSYHTLATRLLEGQGYSFPIGWYPFTPPDTPTAHWSFLYPPFLAAIYAVAGITPLAARLVQAVLGGILLPWMAYRLCKSVFNRREGMALVCAACSAVYAFFALYAATLMTETFYIVAVLWSLERALALRARPTLANGLLLGLSLGLATLLRQSILPWLLPLFVWIMWAGWIKAQLRSTLTALAVVALAVGLCLFPFTLRNYRVYGEFLLLNSNAGYAMYSAQHPMHGTRFQAFAAAPIPDEMYQAGLTEPQMDRQLLRLGIGFVLQEPLRYVLLSLSRVGNYFEFWPTSGTPLVHNLGRVGSFGLFLPFMLYGVWLAIREVRAGSERGFWPGFWLSPLSLLLLFAFFYSILHILTWAMPRYRLPVDAALMPFAALAIMHLGQGLHKRYFLKGQEHQPSRH